MKIARIVAVVVVVLAGWWFISRKTAVPSPAALVKAKPIPVTRELTIEAGRATQWTVSAPEGKLPGLLQGRWMSQGKSANIKGASDDTLVAFTLRGPDNKEIEKLDHPASGNFSIRFEAPGNYTFVFDNSGIIRSSARKVVIEGTYQPD